MVKPTCTPDNSKVLPDICVHHAIILLQWRRFYGACFQNASIVYLQWQWKKLVNRFIATPNKYQKRTKAKWNQNITMCSYQNIKFSIMLDGWLHNIDGVSFVCNITHHSEGLKTLHFVYMYFASLSHSSYFSVGSGNALLLYFNILCSIMKLSVNSKLRQDFIKQTTVWPASTRRNFWMIWWFW